MEHRSDIPKDDGSSPFAWTVRGLRFTKNRSSGIYDEGIVWSDAMDCF